MVVFVAELNLSLVKWINSKSAQLPNDKALILITISNKTWKLQCIKIEFDK